MSKIIDGKKIAERVKDKITKEIFQIKKRPNLAIVLLEGRSDSELYVSLKEKEAKKVGIDTHLYKCASSISEKELLETIEYLNKDTLIDGILVQLPLPESINADKIVSAVLATKDVDGFHPDNLAKIKKGEKFIVPPVYAAIFEMLTDIKADLKDKRVCIITNSEIFGGNLAQMFLDKKAKPKWVLSSDNVAKEEGRKADILITAVGKPGFIKKKDIKKDAIIIDIGINKKENKVCGDVDFDDVEDKTSFISPVPGGVGPLTIAMTFQNVLNLFKEKK